jgi:Putative Ig domain
MQRMIKTFLCVAVLAAGWQQACGFALLGPAPGTPAGSLSTALPANFGDSWQTVLLGYDLIYLEEISLGGGVWLGDLGGPKNIGQGYRRNDPVLYYAYDQNFSDFFGAQGEAAADQAYAIMNNVFTNRPNGVDGYSPNLTEFPFNSQHFNGMAQGLFLTDLKSVTLHLLVEQMGLAEPERFTWTLHNRFVGPSPPSCPENIQYLVVQRNYNTTDQPLTGPQTGTLYSPYVNNILYTYGIADKCSLAVPIWQAISEVFGVQEPGAPEFTAVAANDNEGAWYESSLEDAGPTNIFGGGGLVAGGFYTGLTEDDVAGLRYLMTTNNIVFEAPAAGTQLEATNTRDLNFLETSDVFPLFLFAQTNPPTAVQAAFPNLVIDTVSTNFGIGSNAIVSATLETPAGAPAGSQILVVVTNGWTFFPTTNYSYTFDNIVFVNFHTNTVVQQQTVSIGLLPGEAATGPLFTNVNYQTVILTNVPSGDYYLIPPGSCGLEIVSNIFPNHLQSITTNVVSSATNSAGFVGSINIVTFFTNNWLEFFACNFQTSSPAEYQGIEKVQFLRVADSDVDPLTDRFFIPVTNSYSMTWWNPTNSQLGSQTFQRVVTQPDILMTASDEATGPAGNGFVGSVVRNIFFETGQILPGLAGPGTIDGQAVFNYDDVGTVWYNGPFADTNSFLPGDESGVNATTAIPGLLWGSFDGTTNAPIVYPNNLSIQELENQMIITISPTSLPDGTNDVPYTPTAFSATGGGQSDTFTFSVAAGSQLPFGLALVNNELQGTPSTTNGVYDVTVQMTDSSIPQKTITKNYTITIH